MNFTVNLALLGWPLVALSLCALLPSRRAILAGFIGAWLFLPMASFDPGLCRHRTKSSAICVSLLAGLLFFDFNRLTRFRPKWIDLPMATWCLCPMMSSVLNSLGPYDGVSTCLGMMVNWGLPYLIGRIYFTTVDDLRELAIGMFIGGLVYVPLCLFEIRMSPQLHLIVYGYTYQGFEHSHRFGGWRPAVFMAHGLMVGLWMSMASLVGLWLWMSGSLRSVRGIPLPWFLVPLVVTAVLCKSTGAIILLAMGLIAFALVRRFRLRAAICLGVLAPLYILVRVSGLWSGTDFVDAAKLISSERSASLETRLKQRTCCPLGAAAADLRMGRLGASRVSDESGEDISITDGLDYRARPARPRHWPPCWRCSCRRPPCCAAFRTNDAEVRLRGGADRAVGLPPDRSSPTPCHARLSPGAGDHWNAGPSPRAAAGGGHGRGGGP